jgi:hypothetical protein
MMPLVSQTRYGGGGEDLFGTASMQGDALSGPAAGDMGLNDLLNWALARQREKDAQALKLAKIQARAQRPPRELPTRTGMDAYGPASGYQEGRRVQNFRNLLDSTRTAAQRGSTAVGGAASAAFGDSARQAQALKMGGFDPYEYTGIRDIVMGNSQASEQAQAQAGQNQRAGTDLSFDRRRALLTALRG